jgi:hypothetical protein
MNYSVGEELTDGLTHVQLKQMYFLYIICLVLKGVLSRMSPVHIVYHAYGHAWIYPLTSYILCSHR